MPCPNCVCPSCRALIGSSISTPDKLLLPFSDLITTYFPPTYSEVVHSQDVICSAEKTVPLIQAMIDDLEKRKAGVLSLARMHRAVVSPLRSFPPELLVNIFAAFIAMAACYPTPRWRCSPFALMGICSRWRKIILDTPQLWTRIMGVPPMIDSWIIQSKGLPLNLELNLDSSASRAVLEALIPYAHRWECVDFSLGPNSSILTRAKTHLRSLKRLNLYFRHYTARTVDFCEVAPQLTDVSLTGVRSPVAIKLPWEQLRTCDLDNSGLALHVLQHARNLRTCRLDMPYVGAIHPWRTPGDPHSYHMALDTLIICWSFADPNINSFVSSITLPSLRTLKVDFDSVFHRDSDDYSDIDDQSEVTFITMSGFLERSSAYLSTLTLANIPFSPGELVKCLALAPSLVSLDIDFKFNFKFNFKSRFEPSSIDNELFLALNANLPGYILPHLRSLSLQGFSTFSEEILDAFITSRRQIDLANGKIALLENLTLGCYIPRGQPTDRLPRFHRFVSEGLNITYGRNWEVYNSIQADNSEPPRERA